MNSIEHFKRTQRTWALWGVGVAVFSILLVINLIIVASGEETASPSATSTPIPGYLTYTDMVNGFSISYPEDWNQWPQEWVDAWLGELGVVGFGTTLDQEGYSEDFSVMSEKLYFPVSVEECFKLNTDPPPALEGFTSISEERLVIRDLAAIKYVFTWVSNGETL